MADRWAMRHATPCRHCGEFKNERWRFVSKEQKIPNLEFRIPPSFLRYSTYWTYLQTVCFYTYHTLNPNPHITSILDSHFSHILRLSLLIDFVKGVFFHWKVGGSFIRRYPRDFWRSTMDCTGKLIWGNPIQRPLRTNLDMDTGNIYWIIDSYSHSRR